MWQNWQSSTQQHNLSLPQPLGHDTHNSIPSALDLRVGNDLHSQHYSWDRQLHLQSQSSSTSIVSTAVIDKTPFSLESTSNFSSFSLDKPLMFASHSKADLTQNYLKASHGETFNDFRDRILSQFKEEYAGENHNMRRNRAQSQTELSNDVGYLEKRKKNNESAKKSRNLRRAKEDEMAIRCAYLEQENIKLKYYLENLEKERERLQRLMMNI